MKKLALCICENKDADQSCNREADQRLCFRNIDSTIPLAILCGCTAWFVWGLVQTLEDRFSHKKAHMKTYFCLRGFRPGKTQTATRSPTETR